MAKSSKTLLRVGDSVLITGPAHYEEAKVISVEKNMFLLDNHLTIDKHYNILNNTKCKAEKWDQEKFDLLHAKTMIPKNLYKLSSLWKNLSDEDTLLLNHRLNKIITKFNL